MRLIAFTAFLLFLGLILAVQPACYYDNEQEQYGTTTGSCDTADVKYSTDIQPIIQNNCTICHAPGGEKADQPLTTYPQVKAFAADGKLVQRTHDPNAPMPPTGLLPECDRAKIAAWVNAGALNN